MAEENKWVKQLKKLWDKFKGKGGHGKSHGGGGHGHGGGHGEHGEHEEAPAEEGGFEE
jgi:hypothetical protein